MRKFLRTILTLGFFFVFLQAKAQVSQVTNVTIVSGFYTQGSTIAATFDLGTGCIGQTNSFQLYLSDATGNFTNQTLIGSYASFYSAFVNGTIPTTTPVGLGYRVRVLTTSDGLYSTPSAAFEVRAGTAVTAKATAPAINTANPETFGYCANRVNPSFFITDQSTPTAGTVTATITNKLDGGTPTVIPISTTPTTAFTPGAAHYTMLVKVVMPDGSIATKAYFIINNVVNTAFSTTGAGVVCLPLGALTYGVDVTGINGIQKNFPGNLYHITWGDNSQNDYTFCQLAQTETVTHNYTQSSCGSTFNGKFNVFGININVQSPYCGSIGQPLSTSAKVVTVTENKFTGPLIGCTNADVIFTNTSLPGQNQDESSSECTDNNVTYNWYVNGQLILPNVPKSTNFVHQFLTPGTYEVKLESVSNGTCQGAVFIKNICIQAPPAPAFTLASNLICLTTGTVDANSSASVLNNTCSSTPVYTWTVTPSAGVTFTQGSANPTFRFSQIGIYNIALTIQTVASSPASCAVTTATQRVVVNSEPTATLQGPKTLCVKGDYSFDPTATDTKTDISGNAEDLPTTYTWTVTGGAYTFIGGTTANSKYPKINFADFAAYTVTLTYTNNCNTITRTQQLTFTQAPVVTITAPAQVCYGSTISLQGAITPDANTTFTWSSSSGGTNFAPPTSLTTVYTPTAADLAAHTVTIKLLVTTDILGACAQIAVTKTIIILPRNTGTSDATKSICTGTSTNYTPTSTVANSTFTWTATNADGNATGFSATGTGPINETITNTNATANAVVIYTITPTSPEGCTGDPFTFTVTVTPRPVITTTVPEKTICSNSSSAIAVTSNIPTTFSWTATATNGVTGFAASGAQAPIGTTLSINETLINTGLNNGNVQGTVTYVITPTSPSGCPGTPITVIVHVDPAVTVANAGPDENICSTSTYVLKGNAVKAGETGLWTISPTPAHAVTPTFSDATAPQATVSNLTPGENYVFIWTITGSGTCGSTTDQVAINVNMPTIPGTTSTSGASTVCTGTNTGTITLAGNLGTILRWESSTDGGTTWVTAVNTTTTNTYTYTNITVSTQYRAVVQNGQCTTLTSTATAITVTPADTPATAGPDRTLCNETSVTLQGNTNLLPGETGLWSLVPTTPANPTVTFTDATSPNTTVTGLVAGQTYTFKWTVTGPSACGPTSDDVVITNLTPIANNIISSTSALVCSGQTVTINGATPTGGTGTYTYTWENSTDGGTTWNIIAGETGQNLTFNITVTTSFRRNVSSATCPSVSNAYEIIAQPPITNNTVSASQTICTGIVPAILTGTTPAGADGNFNYQWQSSLDGTTWTNIPAAVSPQYQPPALTATTSYRRIVSTVTCNGAQSNISAAITITVKPNAKADFTWTKDKDCAPFVINTSVITTNEYPDRNDTYTWFANDVQIGTGASFPGYTITNSNESVTIKLVVTPSTGCLSDELIHVFSTNQSAAATYTQSATQGCGPLLVTFVNTSVSLTDATFRWDFGNGTGSSAAQPPAVTYLSEATGKDTTYTVTLTATTSCGISTSTSTVFVKAKPISRFSPSKTEGCSPMTVTFSNTSPGGTNTFYYDFGDGTLLTKTDKSTVSHTYVVTATTDFTVKMIAENECGRDESSYVLRVSPQNITPELVVNANEKQGCAPLTVNFINNSIGASRFTFDFGDGGTLNTVTTGTVQHTFTRAGTFTITMTAFNSCSEVSTTETITVLPQPVAAFDADNTLGCPGLPVQFRNTTQDGFSYLWDFGDGTTSDEFEPKHVYSGDQEYYTVTLTATNTQGCKISLIRNQYIHIVLPPVAQFNVNPSVLISIPNYTFRFEDESTNTPTVWAWDFGDGVKSTLQNPSHTYLDTGSYVVTLRVANQQGCFTTTFKTVRIVGVPGYLYVPNSFMPGSETPELRVFMAKGSGIKSWTMSVFNKWGQTLWQTSKLDEGRPVEWWDGTFNSIPQPQGVFFWKIDVEFINGTEWKGMTYDSKAPKKTGVIHLLR